MIKIIFLDIDGVMNNSQTMLHNYRTWEFDQVPVECLKRILAATDAYIVISGALGRALHIDDMRAIFESHGIRGNRILGTTRNVGDRGDDIDDWLAWCTYEDQIQSYILIDDAGPPNIGRHHRRLVHTTSDVGLAPEDVDKAIALLNERTF